MDHADIPTRKDAAGAETAGLPSLSIRIPAVIPTSFRTSFGSSVSGSGTHHSSSKRVAVATPVSSHASSFSAAGAASSLALASPTNAIEAAGSSSVGAAPSGSPNSGGLSLQKPTLLAVPLPTSKWIPDDKVLSCQAQSCGQPFTLFNRKHHCRTCGGIFCSNCSSNTIPAKQGAVLRVCVPCYYDHQVVVSKYTNGSRRRRSRGEFKLLPAAILVEFASFMAPHDLNVLGLVSSDFYFASRSNAVWSTLNVLCWSEREDPTTSTAATDAVRPGHMRYDYTQFLWYVQRMAQARCDGVATFASSVRHLLSQKVKITVVGPSDVGKSALIRQFVGLSDPVRQSTVGFVPFTKRVALSGGLSTETTLTIYDTGGASRYETLRTLCCVNSHVILLCYNVHSKMSLVEAAVTMGEIEPHLTSQAVVVCGVNTENSHSSGPSLPKPREVTEKDAEAASVRCRRSLQVALRQPNEAFEAAVQAVVDRLVSNPCSTLPTPTVLDVLLEP